MPRDVQRAQAAVGAKRPDFATIYRALGNRRFLRLLAVFAVSGIAAAIPASLVLFFLADVLQAGTQAGAYLALMGVAALSLAVMSRIPFPTLPGQGTTHQQGRPTAEIVRQPVFIIAAAACAIGYGVMNLLMAATPIAMAQCNHPFSAAALVLEWHVLAMFVPSFFTGKLIKRFGVLPIMTLGLALNIACVAFALHGNDVMHFLGALMALGLPLRQEDDPGYRLLQNAPGDLHVEVQQVQHDSRVHLDIESDDLEAEARRLEALAR